MNLPAQDRAEWHAALQDPHLPYEDADYSDEHYVPQCCQLRYAGISEDPWHTGESTCSPW